MDTTLIFTTVENLISQKNMVCSFPNVHSDIAITIGVILLIDAGKNSRKKFSSSKKYAVIGIIMVSIFSSSLFSIFKRKLQVYQFR